MIIKTDFRNIFFQAESYIFFAILLLALNCSGNGQITSIHTKLTGQDCKILENQSTGGVKDVEECKGIEGYKLQNIASFLRGSVNVISPANEKSELNIWNYFLENSTIGEQAEWRIKDKNPFAVIIPITVYENLPESTDSTNPTEYLIVAKISNNSACITDIVKPGKDQRSKARNLADASSKTDCKTPDF